MNFSSENGVINVALRVSLDATSGVQPLSFSYDADNNVYVVHSQPFSPDIAISGFSISSDFSSGYVNILFVKPFTQGEFFPGRVFSITNEKVFKDCSREQRNHWRPDVVCAPNFAPKETINLIS